MTFQILPPPGSSTPIGNTGDRRSRWELTSRLGYAGHQLALFESQMLNGRQYSGAIRLPENPVTCGDRPGASPGMWTRGGFVSSSSSSASFLLFRQAHRVLHAPLPRVLAAGVEGGAAPLVPPPCRSPSSHQRSVFDTTPFPESSSQVGKLRLFEERSKERHERLNRKD